MVVLLNWAQLISIDFIIEKRKLWVEMCNWDFERSRDISCILFMQFVYSLLIAFDILLQLRLKNNNNDEYD